MKNKLILYIAMSLDGYIAEKNGSIHFLDETAGPSPICTNFTKNIEVAVGRFFVFQ